MIKNPKERLGSKGDAEEIKKHPYFKDVNWDDVYNKKIPPPSLKVKGGVTEYFSKPRLFMDDEDYEKERISNGQTDCGSQRFEGWSFVQNLKDLKDSNKPKDLKPIEKKDNKKKENLFVDEKKKKK